jgi:rare lipoprotein A
MRRLLTILLLGLAATLAACATPTPTPPAPAAPRPTAEQPTFHQEGVASWYGATHQGRITANGERFDMESMTAAHRTLRFGTIVRVTNLATGRMVKVRINDRGPYVGARVIDLSASAARNLDMAQKGTARVRIEAYASDQNLGNTDVREAAQPDD